MNFGVMGSLWLWRGGRWMGASGGMGGVPTHMHMYAQACTCTQAHLYCCDIGQTCIGKKDVKMTYFLE